MRRYAVLAPGLALCACLCGCAPDPQVTTAQLRLRALPSCAVHDLQAMHVTATGDFPPHHEQLSVGTDAPETFDHLPSHARYLVFQGGEGGDRVAGVVPLSGRDAERSLLLLPLGRSCPLGDPASAAGADAAVAALPDGSLFIAGGYDARGEASSRAVVLHAGEEIAHEVPFGMLSRRVGASATFVGGLVLVIGGAQDQSATAHEAYEVYDSASGGFDASRSDKLALGPRRDHAAALLPDGRVLVVGGQRAADGAAFASAEVIDPIERTATGFGASLRHARIAPQVVALDSGTLIVVGGYDAPDREMRKVVRALEHVNLERGRFDEVGDLPEYDEGVAAAIEGERIAFFGCREIERAAGHPGRTCELTLSLLSDGFERVTVLSAEQLEDGDGTCDPDRGEVCDLHQLRMVSLPDTRLLLTGRVGTTRQAFLLDPRRGEVEAVRSSRVPAQLLRLADGTIAALDEFGASLSRLDSATPFDAPAEDMLAALVAQTPDRAQLDGDRGWTAERRSRLDVPHLRLADFVMTLELAQGNGELLLEGREGLFTCQLSGRVRISRRGDTVRPEASPKQAGEEAGEARCPDRALAGHVGIALRLEAAARLRALRIERL